MISNLSIGKETGDGAIAARANYVVLQVLLDRPDATLHQVGTYYDKFRRTADGLRLAERRCVYDNLLVPNALCVPV
jgi:anthranilate 1,2-dioxygenase small subunit